jgi:hypothetical protein
MKYRDFEILINTIQKNRENSHQLYMMGIDVSSYNDDLFKIIDILMEKAFGEINKEWIDWFVYERITPSGEILKAHDTEGNEICYDIKSLWEEITN